MTTPRTILRVAALLGAVAWSGCDDMRGPTPAGGSGGGAGGSGGAPPPPMFCTEVCEDDLECAPALCEAGACVGCRENTDCPPSAPFCQGNECLECLSDTDCEDEPNRPRCSATGTCICAGSDDCTVPGLQECRNTGCVCSDDSGCAGIGPEICVAGACIACNDDDDCPPTASKCLSPGSVGSFCGCRDPSECPGDVCSEEGMCLDCDDAQDCVDLGLGDDCVDNVCTCSAATACSALTTLHWECAP